MTTARVALYAVLMLLHPALRAQQAAQDTRQEPPSADPAPVTTLDEIVVSAQHRIERLQDVPLSVQVIGGEQIARQNLNNLTELSRISPSVHVGGSARSNELYIRGIGSGVNQSFDQSVGLFVDNIYHGRARMTETAFFDLDRAEILKGPQSTFFGNNAVAGAFNIVTRKPDAAFDASGRAFHEPDGNRYAVEAAVGGPLNEIFGVRVAGIYSRSNGWLDNIATGRKQPEEENWGARVSLGLYPSDVLDAVLKLERTDNRSRSGFFLEVDDCPPPVPFVADGFCGALLGMGLPTTIGSNVSSPGQLAFTRSEEVMLTVSYDSLGHTFTSVSGYYAYDYDLNFDSDLTPLTLFNIKAPEQYRQFSQELRVASATGGRFEYLAGAYYQHDRLAFMQDFSFYFLSPVIEGAPPFGPLLPYLPLGQRTGYVQDESVHSVFGSLTWNFTDRLKLTGGLRASMVRKRYDWKLHYGTTGETYGGIDPLPQDVAALPALLGLGEPGALDGKRTDHALMPSAKLQYQLTPTAMTYLSYSRGFKAGGFNGADNTADPANLPFGPEHVNAYELGLKTEWRDRTLLANMALFRSEYDDLQVAANIAIAAGTFLSVVRNAASSRSQGAELELEWVASDALRLYANATYLHARYLGYPNVTATAAQRLQGQSLQDLSGKPTTYAPDWSGNLRATHLARLPGGYGLTSEATVLFSSRFHLDPTNDPQLMQGGYARVDVRLSLENPDGRWTFDLIGQNLTDREIRIFATGMPLSPGSVILQRQQPRNVALQVRYKW